MGPEDRSRDTAPGGVERGQMPGGVSRWRGISSPAGRTRQIAGGLEISPIRAPPQWRGLEVVPHAAMRTSASSQR